MGIWSVVIGLFLLDSAARVVRSAPGSTTPTVAQMMRLPVAIEPALSMIQFVDTFLPLHQQTCFPVAQQGRLYGVLSLKDLKIHPRERWRELCARDVMRPVSPLLFVEQSSTMTDAVELMKQNGLGALAVVNGTGNLVGFLETNSLRKR